MNMELDEITNTAVTSPANHVPDFVAVHSVTMTLPFAELTWENFEKLCYRLAGKDADVESHSLYGRAGQAQQGIDIFARKRNGRYNTWQAKRYKNIHITILIAPVRHFCQAAGRLKRISFILSYNVLLMM
ncbi:hypothetical protein LJU39_11160 [Citrobacter freundii]|uniref:hypothetical protein n=1 Tax=Citrobacter TaxID=544 RepID=UPI00174BD273|nr:MULTISPECIES: hypothetical protein [unclassified Citrobacter]MBY5091434.1 hypothetical protein [Citrobacter freundii]MDM2762544.1 hypothetical protein [Citrobacter sp. Cpo150]MDM2919084.1 hypothetical protein [Citrobacter sp. Cpo032]NTZ33324.1 hypothetical protein [Citrobacter freundii]UDV55170.1 hypothetical protein LJU39_11160 [Citrobacter freundii]